MSSAVLSTAVLATDADYRTQVVQQYHHDPIAWTVVGAISPTTPISAFLHGASCNLGCTCFCSSPRCATVLYFTQQTLFEDGGGTGTGTGGAGGGGGGASENRLANFLRVSVPAGEDGAGADSVMMESDEEGQGGLW